ncbi:MAG: Eco57I restriction-modification methylase domain-containing protein [Acidobacteria bacterium]|nr:Eco57I restriction-modification methylase domain-containing protein [Acidobacteriota bacterium]
MKLNTQTPKQALNKAFLKQPIRRDDITLFKTNLQILLGKTNENESEEHHKNFVRDFLLKTFYQETNEINTKGRQDLVIHIGKNASDKVGIILETKKPTSQADMISADNPNRKALHELVLYFLRERIDENNIDVKYLIVTNIYEWFIFEASVFNQLFFENKTFVKDYKQWRDKQKTTVKTDLFYNEIAKPYIETIEREIACTYFDIRDYETALENADLKDDESLIELFKILSPHHLLKVPFADDSNKLDKYFYTELLHIIGLEEIKDKGKLKIQRKAEARRDAGSLIENALTIMKTEDLLPNVANIETYGDTKEERLFNVALDLCLTWINRVLFLKLLEAQLVDYHNKNREYRFLNTNTIQDFDGLYRLFHQVLAINFDERIPQVKEKFWHVPYLNSSLFEFTDLEKQTLKINGLNNGETLNLINTTVLKEIKNQRGELPTLRYLFKFLDAYDFASEGREGIKENNRSLINASVLGKVFEKINGYKDGSIYTPGFITMYMCRQAIRLAVMQKFKDRFSIDIDTFEDLEIYVGRFYKTANILEFNAVINSLRLCDPAVGSGHFLVSSLNEIIAIKSKLGILADESGKPFPNFEITIENDELTVFDISTNGFFKYRISGGKPTSKEAQRLQKTLFHEKQTLIENCLFGVDINPNSVKICRLRLWIELLKNAYYKESSGFAELETLPNIDINIKEGNSLVSRFALDADLKEVLSQVQYSIEDYRNFVLQYKETRDREAKRDFETKIKQIKSDFKTQLLFISPERVKLRDLKNQLLAEEQKTFLFGEDEDKQKERLAKQEKLRAEIEKQSEKIKQIEENAIYRNAFEWRFEFPEVLDNDGKFLGFDIVIGNPPYIGIEDIVWDYRRLFEQIYKTATGRFDLYSLFIEKAMQIRKLEGNFAFIIPGKFLNNKQVVYARKIVCESHNVNVLKIDDKVFDNAQVNSVIIENNYYEKNNNKNFAKYQAFNLTEKAITFLSETNVQNVLNDSQIIFRLEINSNVDELLTKIQRNTSRVKEIAVVKDGIVAGVVKDVLFIKEKLDDDSHKLYFGKHLSKYHLADTDIWVNYKPDEMMKEEINRKEGKRAGLWMRDRRIFEREKILSRFVGKEIIATYDNENNFYEHTLHSTHITSKAFYTKYVLSLFNSKLFKFYYQKTNSQGGDIFPQIRISSVENLPIKKIEEKDQQPFVALVDQILELKKAGKDTQALEDEIDRLVYRLYDLTDDEIKIVEGKGN